MDYNELKDSYSGVRTELDAIDNKYESTLDWSVEDAESYKGLLNKAEELQNSLADHPEALRDRKDALDVPAKVANISRSLATLSQNISVTPACESDPRFGYATDNAFLTDVVNAYTSGVAPSDQMKSVINAVGSDEYSAGAWKQAGVMIPEGFLSSIISVTPEDDQLLGRMTSVPMNVPSLNIPAAVDKDHSTSFTGGTRVYRTGETLTVDKTRDSYEKIKLEATELVGESAVTKELLRYSSISIPSLINDSMRMAMSYKRRDEIINGDGNGKYLGFLNPQNGALKSVQRKVGQATGDIITGENILEMRRYVWGYDNAVWVFNHDLMENIAQLHIESPNNAGMIKLYAPQQGDVPETLLGRPIVWTEFMPGITAGNDGNIHTEWGAAETGLHFAACVNMSAYLHGQLYTDSAVSAHVRFSEREEVFQFVTADDARPSWLSALTPKRGVTGRTPFVALDQVAAT